MRVIKKYSNRKLYDTKESCYINLSDLFETVKNGVEVSVVDKSGKDITTQTLLQAVLERGKSEEVTKFDQQTLVSIINTGDGTLAGYIQQRGE